MQASETVEGAAWAAVRPAWGNASLRMLSIPKNGRILSLVPADPWAPIIIVAGRPTDFESADAFTAAVLAAELAVESAE